MTTKGTTEWPYQVDTVTFEREPAEGLRGPRGCPVDIAWNLFRCDVRRVKFSIVAEGACIRVEVDGGAQWKVAEIIQMRTKGNRGAYELEWTK